jgi:ABC-type metal ion transport system substrate-binding protein
MALKIYNAINASRRRLGQSTITFSPKGGIFFSKEAAKKLKLKSGDKISIAQDEKNVKNWYLFLDKNGIEIKLQSNGHLKCYSVLICEDIRACVKDINEEKSIAMMLVDEPVYFMDKIKYFPIITSSTI